MEVEVKEDGDEEKESASGMLVSRGGMGLSGDQPCIQMRMRSKPLQPGRSEKGFYQDTSKTGPETI